MFSLDEDKRNFSYCFNSLVLLILAHKHWVKVSFLGLLPGFLSFQLHIHVLTVLLLK